MQHKPFTAGALDVCIQGTQLAAPAHAPADTHPRGLVLLQTQVALVVAVLADGDALEPRRGALEMDFAAERLFLFAADQGHRTGEVGVLLGVGESRGADGEGGQSGLGVV